MSKWTGLDKPITLADAESEPLAQRLSFERRTPSPETAAMLRKVEQPELLAADVAQMRAKRRPRAA